MWLCPHCPDQDESPAVDGPKWRRCCPDQRSKATSVAMKTNDLRWLAASGATPQRLSGPDNDSRQCSCRAVKGEGRWTKLSSLVSNVTYMRFTRMLAVVPGRWGVISRDRLVGARHFRSDAGGRMHGYRRKMGRGKCDGYN